MLIRTRVSHLDRWFVWEAHGVVLQRSIWVGLRQILKDLLVPSILQTFRLRLRTPCAHHRTCSELRFCCGQSGRMRRRCACDEKNPLSNSAVRFCVEKSRIFHYLAFMGIPLFLSLCAQVRGLPIYQNTAKSTSPRDDGSLYRKVLLKDKGTISPKAKGRSMVTNLHAYIRIKHGESYI